MLLQLGVSYVALLMASRLIAHLVHTSWIGAYMVQPYRYRQRLGDALTQRLHENTAVAPQDGARLREAAALALSTYGLPMSLPRLPAAGPNGGENVHWVWLVAL